MSQPPTLVQSLPDILIVQMHSIFPSAVTHGKAFNIRSQIQNKSIPRAEKIGNCAGGRKCTVSEASVCHWQSIKQPVFHV
jgi:hypothetical protein